MRKTRTRTVSASSSSERPSESKPRLVNANNLRRRIDLSGLTEQEREAFYAGAKFDTLPGNALIPTPPMKWTIQEGPRSQSTPCSPITVSSGKPCSIPSPSNPIKVDLESLFGTKRSVSTEFGDSELGRLLKSASVPSQGMMMERDCHNKGISAGVAVRRDISASPTGTLSPTILVKKLESSSSKSGMVAKQQTPAHPLPTPSSPVVLEPIGKKVSGISGQDLMELLKSESPRQRIQPHRPAPVIKLGSSRCQFEFDHHDDSVDSHRYNKDVTNHLKSILKVSITA